MLNPFPQLLDFHFFAPTIIRIVAGLAFLGAAFLLQRRHKELAHISFPIIGRASWWVWTATIAQGLVGAMLLVGYYTQYAAIAGMIIALKGAVLAKRYPRAFPLCRLEYIFILAICASLMLSGAGTLAFDLRL
jgi:hypothetical protein